MPKKLIYNPENPKGILVDFTDAELSQKVIDDEKRVIRKTEFNAEQVAAVEAKSSAIEKLKSLGLTDAEIASITGG